jgi:uncharacterized protein (TIRG00374 family)
MQRPFTRSRIGVAIGILVSAVALFLAIRWSGWDALKEALARVDLRLVGFAILLFLLSMIARVFAWRALLGWRFTVKRVFKVLNEGYLLNNLLPWRLGEVGRAVLLGQGTDDSILTVLSSIFIERMYDLLLAASLLLVLFPFAVRLEGAVAVAAVLGLGVIVLIIVIRVAVDKPAWHRAVAARLPGGESRWMPLVGQFRQGVRALEDWRIFRISAGWIVLSWALAGLQYWFVLRAIIPNAALLWAYFMLPVALLGGAIPSSPGSIGVFEAGAVLSLSAFGVRQADALAAALILHGINYAISSIIGAIALMNEGETFKGLYLSVQAWITASAHRQIQ